MQKTTLDKNLYQKSLFSALLEARKKYGKKTIVLEDAERNPISYDRLVLGSLILGDKITAFTKAKEHVGILLPNVNGVAVTFFALSAYGRVPAMLNFSAGLMNLKAACKAAEIKTILSSKRFIEKAELGDLITELEKVVNIVWLDDIKEDIKLGDKLKGLWRSKTAKSFYEKQKGGGVGVGTSLSGASAEKSAANGDIKNVKSSDIGAILFTSGSEGVPKGVVLSHTNILANVNQIYNHTNWSANERIFNPLPVFHCFGLTAGMLMPILKGMYCFLYPSPLHYKTIPPLIKKVKATTLFGTDTFLTGFARSANDGDFDSLRYIIGGAERIKKRTRALWQEKFNLELCEGYGATECAPVISCNTLEGNKHGSVGKILVDIEHRLEPVKGIDDGGRLFVRGANIMQGYFRVENPEVLEPPKDGWHDTGDIVSIDKDNFITIKGRAKRFAKIGGEMVSLAGVEAYASSLWAEHTHAVVGIEHKTKGEQLVLITDFDEANRHDLSVWAKEHGVPDLFIPKKFVFVEEIPMLATGKTDYGELGRLAGK
jgi:acyl-[acyl-carrier-protein]-phospholipid O-acyltransferase/long-chain-fatty-acid--[acyl-carrier-protein] ligase